MPSGRSAGSLGGPASAPPPRLCYDAVLPTPERSRILPGPCEGPSGVGSPQGQVEQPRGRSGLHAASSSAGCDHEPLHPAVARGAAVTPGRRATPRALAREAEATAEKRAAISERKRPHGPFAPWPVGPISQGKAMAKGLCAVGPASCDGSPLPTPACFSGRPMDLPSLLHPRPVPQAAAGEAGPSPS